MNILYLVLFFICLLGSSGNSQNDLLDSDSDSDSDSVNQINFGLYNQKTINYKKRCWSSKDNKFQYYDSFQEGENLKNYYSLVFLSLKENKDHPSPLFLYLISSYKDVNYPVGNWSYFNVNEKIFKKQFYKAGKVEKETIYIYDKGYNQKEIHEYLANNNGVKELKASSYYFYDFDKKDKNKKILRKIDHYNQGIFLESVYFDYDQNLRIIKESVYVLNYQLKNYTHYIYNENGYKIKEENYNREHKKFFYSHYLYDVSGKLIEKRDFLKDKDKFEYHKQYLYKYGNNSLLKEKKLNENDSKKKRFVNVYTINYIYNKDDCMLSESRFDSKNKLVEKINY